MRSALRAGLALPRLGVFLSGDRECGRSLLAQVAGVAADCCKLLRFRCARSGRHRAAWRADRVLDRPHWWRLSPFRHAAGPNWKKLPSGLRGGGRLPGLDVSAGWLWRTGRHLLSEEPHHTPAAPAVLHFRRGAIINAPT